MRGVSEQAALCCLTACRKGLKLNSSINEEDTTPDQSQADFYLLEANETNALPQSTTRLQKYKLMVHKRIYVKKRC